MDDDNRAATDDRRKGDRRSRDDSDYSGPDRRSGDRRTGDDRRKSPRT